MTLSDRRLSTKDSISPCRSFEVLGVGVALVLCGLLYFGTALRLPGAAFDREPSGYYGLLTAGFRAGHLHLPIEPHPALLALPNPYDPVANAPYRVHDMSLWAGKYYLYFGPTPVLIWFWPIAALTGFYPSEALAIATFLFGGLGLTAILLVAIRRRWFPAAPVWISVLGTLVMGLGSPAPILAQAAEFYHVPIAAAYFLHLATLVSLFLALSSPRHPAAWLALASLMYGLVVGARPNFVFCGAAVGFVWLGLLLRQRNDPGTWGRKRVVLTLAAALPAALCGGGLMVYNWLRFGSVTELGIHYQLAGSDQQTYQPFSTDAIWPTAQVYLWGGGNWTPYFPFFSPAGGATLGLFRYLPWVWLSLGALVVGVQRVSSAAEDRRPAIFAWAVLIAGLANLVVLSCFSGVNARYATDIYPTWLLLGSVGALAVAARSHRWRLPLRVVTLVVALVTIGTGTATFYTRLSPPRGEETWARLMNGPTHLWERMAGIERGALRVDVEFPLDRPIGHMDPIFETGPTADQRNWLHVEYLEGNRARFGFFHAGLGTLNSDEFLIPANRRSVVEVQCGSLLPPFAHPAFSGLSRRDYDGLRRILAVKIDGVSVLASMLDCYQASPNDLRVGGRGWIGDAVGEDFSGRIFAAKRLPLDVTKGSERKVVERVPLEFEIQFPWGKGGSSEPLLATGEALAGDLLYVTYEADNYVRFGFDHFGGGGPRSASIRYDPGKSHRVTVWLGALAASDRSTMPREELSWARRLVVLFDGEVVMNTEQNFYAADPESLIVGYNANRHSTASSAFSGRITTVGSVGFDRLPPLRYSDEYGPVEMMVVFPDQLAGLADPLVVTGKTGAGNLVYVRYVDAGHIRLGFDHWGIGGVESDLIPVNYAVPHRLRITMGSLYPEGSEGTSRSRVRVEVGGRPALDTVYATHPTERAAIKIGTNPIGGSTCGERFNGRILWIRRDSDFR